MKIVHIMAGGQDGGAEAFFVEAIRALHEAGVEQAVITRDNNDNKINAIRDLGIPLETATFNRHLPWKTKKTIAKVIETFKPDIIQHRMARAGMFAVKGNHINIGWYGSFTNKKYFKNCSDHIVTTERVKKQILAQGGIDDDAVHVLPNYTNTKMVAPLNRAEFDTPDDAPLLLSLARLHPCKALDTLVSAMVQVPNAYLWIAGSGDLEKDLKNQAAHLNLADRIKFLGWRDDREALLATADLSVFPSRQEAFGAVIIESWATKTPLVAAKADGPVTLITHDHNGMLVDVDDVDDLANAINAVLNDKELQAKLTQNGLDEYTKNYTKTAFQTNAMGIYNALLSNQKT